MQNTLVRLLLLAALLELGFSVFEWKGCRSKERIFLFNEKSGEVLKINWRPLSVFPEEAKRFQ